MSDRSARERYEPLDWGRVVGWLLLGGEGAAVAHLVGDRLPGKSVDVGDEFRTIIGASISCEVQIDKPFDDVQLACQQGDVRLNGTPLSCPSEWQVKPGVNNVIELVGSACDTFKSGSSTFTAEFPCGAIVVE